MVVSGYLQRVNILLRFRLSQRKFPKTTKEISLIIMSVFTFMVHKILDEEVSKVTVISLTGPEGREGRTVTFL